MNPDELIDALGGSSLVAEAIGVGTSTVGNWRKRGFPAWAMPALSQLCVERGVDPRGALDPLPPRRMKAQTEATAD